MNSLLLSVNVVMPLFLLMLAGFACRRANILGSGGLDAFNKLLNYVLLPAMLFLGMYRSELGASINPGLLGFLFVAVTLSAGGLVLIVPRLVRLRRRGAAIQGLFRGNSSMFAIPVAMLLFEGRLGQMPVLISLAVILYNIYGVLVLERFGGRSAKAAAILRSLATNPLVLGVLLGLLFRLLPVKLPDFVVTALDALGSATTGLGFLALGASFTLASARLQNRRILVACVAGKLVLLPLVWLTAAVLLGYRGNDLSALMILLAAPTALSSFPIAKEFGADAALAGEIVIFTSVFSVLSVFVWILGLSGAGLI